MSYRYISDVRYIVARYSGRNPIRKTYWAGRRSRWVKDSAKAKDFMQPLVARAEAERLCARCNYSDSFVQYEQDVRKYDYNGPWPPV